MSSIQPSQHLPPYNEQKVPPKKPSFSQQLNLLSKLPKNEQIKMLHEYSFQIQKGVLKSGELQKISDIAANILQHTWGIVNLSKELAFLERVQIAALLQKKTSCISLKEAESWKKKFRESENKALIKKWEETGIDLRGLLYNPDLTSFVFETHLNHSAHYYSIPVTFNEKTRSLETMIEGKNRDLLSFQEKVTIQPHPIGQGTEIVTKENHEETWCFLPQTGFTRRNESNWKKLEPITTLTKNQVESATSKAMLCSSRDGEKDHVLEIVSTFIPKKGNAFTTGFQTNFGSPRHVWIRMIKPDGTFYSVGFNLGKVTLSKTALTKGVFRSPDPYEGLPGYALPITGIRITEGQFHSIIQDINKLQNEETQFQFLEQNCTRFLNHVIDSLDLETVTSHTKVKKPILHASVSEIFFRMQPLALQRAEKKINQALKPITETIKSFIAPVILKIFAAIAATFRMITERIILAVSGRGFAYSKKGVFPEKNENPHDGIPWYNFFDHIKITMEENLIRTFLPIKLIEWQLGLKTGTRVIPPSTRFCEQYGGPLEN